MFARVVGYLLLYPPSDQARAVVQNELEHCKDERNPNEAVYDLGEMYVMDFILPFYSDAEDDRTPRPSPPCSRASFQLIKQNAYQGRVNRPRNNFEAQPLALVRDDNRCMLTRIWDLQSWHAGLSDEKPTDRAVVRTDSCHIFRQMLANTRPVGRDGATREDYMAARLWPILERFGYGHIHDELRGDKVHRLENVLALDCTLHCAFGNMTMWFEELYPSPSQANRYHVAVSDPKWYDDIGRFGLPHEIQFVAHANLPLPNPTYLHIHAACCRVANLSGAADYLLWMLNDLGSLDKTGKFDHALRYLCYRLVHSA
ncbi:hypothetical protein LXA43DRAFT_888778 [Ganoderma leucocontextum]|nr:hypothetical protein LXA43DRAFT_888778 [Ganoderma leucocontextum]